MYKLTLLLLFPFLGAFANPGSNLPLGAAINLAGKQRMLTQRMGKDYLLKVLGENKKDAQKELDLSIILFEENHRLLKEFTPNNAIGNELRRVENIWAMYKPLVTGEASIENASTLISGNESMLKACSEVAALIEEYALATDAYPSAEHKEVQPLLTTASKSRMNIQRVALYYTAWYGKINEEASKANLKTAFDDFQAGLTTMFTAGVHSQVVDDALAAAIQEWAPYRDDFAGFVEKKYGPMEIDKLAADMCQLLDKVVKAYESVLDK